MEGSSSLEQRKIVRTRFTHVFVSVSCRLKERAMILLGSFFQSKDHLDRLAVSFGRLAENVRERRKMRRLIVWLMAHLL